MNAAQWITYLGVAIEGCGIFTPLGRKADESSDARTTQYWMALLNVDLSGSGRGVRRNSPAPIAPAGYSGYLLWLYLEYSGRPGKILGCLSLDRREGGELYFLQPTDIKPILTLFFNWWGHSCMIKML